MRPTILTNRKRISSTALRSSRWWPRGRVADAGLTFTVELGERRRSLPAPRGGQTTEDVEFHGLYATEHRVHPLTIPNTMANAGASSISLEHGITGPVYTVSTACSSANHAIGQAFWMVRNGMAEVAIAGGSEAPFSVGLLKAWEAMRVVSPDTCRPFSRDRRGLILGEGAAMLVLEPLERAESRGARILGEIVGFDVVGRYHLTQPSARGAARAMRAALRDGATPRTRSATSTRTAPEPRRMMRPRLRRSARCSASTRELLVSSTKSMHGHALGAAGALEAVATLLALRRGILPPTANFTTPDPACDLDVMPNIARAVQVECALSNSFAFGGLNAVLVLRA